MPALKRYSLLGLILLGAGVLRLYGIERVGILNVDEGRYLLDGLSKQVEIEECWDLFRAKLEERRGGRQLLLAQTLPAVAAKLGRHHPFAPKSGFSYLTAAVMLARGFHVWAATLVEAASGILAVWALYVLVREVRNVRAGLIAAAMLAVSCYAVYYSRNAYPQWVSMFPLLLAVWLHARWDALSMAEDGGAAPQKAWACLLGCGALAGLSFWTNYQVAGALPLFVVVHAAASLRGRTVQAGVARLVRGGALVCAGFLAVMACAEALSYPMILLFRSQGTPYPHKTFLELLWPRLTAQSSVPIEASGLLVFPFFLGLFEGWAGALVLAILAGWGVWMLARRCVHDGNWLRSDEFRRPALYLGVAFAVPFLVFSLKTIQGARMFTNALPFFLGMLACGVDAAWQRGRVRSRVCLTILLGAAAVSALVHNAEIVRIRSAYPDVVRLVAAGGKNAYAGWSSVLECYLTESGLMDDRFAVGLQERKPFPEYFVSDWQELYNGRYPDASPLVPAGAQPVQVFQHDFGRIFLEAETFPSFGSALSNIRWVRGLDLERARRLLVYETERPALRPCP